MSKIAVVYWSGTGNTEAMGGNADLFPAGEFSAEKAKEYTAFAFGCPSMGSEQLEEIEFEPMYQSVKPELNGKAVVLFGSYGWGDGEWMRIWAEDCEAAGCRLLAEPVTVNGAALGLDAEACKELGKTLARA